MMRSTKILRQHFSMIIEYMFFHNPSFTFNYPLKPSSWNLLFSITQEALLMFPGGESSPVPSRHFPGDFRLMGGN